MAINVLRGEETLHFQAPAVTVDDRAYRDVSIDPQESLVPELGVFGKQVNSTLAMRNGLRSYTGIYVVATIAGNEDAGAGPVSGDVITSLNGTPILGMQELRGAIHRLAGKPAFCRSSGTASFSVSTGNWSISRPNRVRIGMEQAIRRLKQHGADVEWIASPTGTGKGRK